MPFLRDLTISAAAAERPEFPFTLPLIRRVAASGEAIRLDAAVTFFVGENGTGKSTLLEGIAAASRLAALGASDLDRDPTLEAARRLASELRIARSGRPKRGLFFRAEDFFGFTKRLLASAAEFRAEEAELSEELSGYGQRLATGVVRGQRLALEARYGEDPDASSHGESVLGVLQSRVLPRGLYLLDEPETPLSPLRQLALLSLLKRAVAEGSQFLIATHSPILMAFPDARLLWFEDDRVEERAYESIEHVALTRDFLANPDAFLREL